ncbi:flagellar hook-basal body complex protein FliE [Phorcysia thermohydrogeniphila]|uniref:Flagellar hook-basal body complex protein FliE n=1 Tax=Phorcysia thermohydrogeniphila TaxID=936138 RepID=A0A4R1GB04_9BACT|nr:flagellar hook-basal body complex protein FliE [Phorcysia thermohydrogeniphila]TCK03883.1 flagellar hook-basal body complex protein FliE [Phorcysia thermohydrogeniphila]
MKVSFDTNIGSTFGLEVKEKKVKSGFKELIENFIEDVNRDQLDAKAAEEALIKGNVENIEELMYRIEKAELSLRLLVEIRNKALESYQEIMRMQV